MAPNARMSAEQQVIPLKLGWRIDGGFILCLYHGHVLEQRASDDRLCWVMIDNVISCRIESDTLSTEQLPLGNLPVEFHSAVNRLIGQALELIRLRTEHELLQYINPP